MRIVALHRAIEQSVQSVQRFSSGDATADSKRLNVQLIDWKFGTLDPTTDPTTDPTEAPTQPTANPTSDPTEGPSQPTESPTNEPSSVPTQPPALCETIYVQIEDFDILTPDDIKDNESLQIMMANITHFAISEQAEILEIDRDDFFVNFHNVSYSLYMVHTLCSFAESTLTILLSFISSHGDDIGASMEQRLVSEYGVVTIDTLEVIIAIDPIQFSQYL